jgi:hypothetical protein
MYHAYQIFYLIVEPFDYIIKPTTPLIRHHHHTNDLDEVPDLVASALHFAQQRRSDSRSGYKPGSKCYAWAIDADSLNGCPFYEQNEEAVTFNGIPLRKQESTPA